MSTFIKYKEYRFSDSDVIVVGQANWVIEQFEQKGYSMTLRQIYYQFLSKEWMDDWWKPVGGKSSKDQANSPKSYNRLKKLMTKARRAGLISWTAIEDRQRPMYGTSWVESPAEAMTKARRDYALDLWHNQPMRPFALVEKDGQLGIVGGICSELRIDYASCRGYTSESAIWRLGQKCAAYVRKGQRPVALHMSDHDPSGIDMTRDVREKLELFAGAPVQVIRLALNMNQIRTLNLPPNYAKVSDSRAKSYIEEYGTDCWEMDAPSPEFTTGLIRSAVVRLRDERLWDEALAEEAADKNKLDQMIEEM